jgi:hypothetical protein
MVLTDDLTNEIFLGFTHYTNPASSMLFQDDVFTKFDFSSMIYPRYGIGEL